MAWVFEEASETEDNNIELNQPQVEKGWVFESAAPQEEGKTSYLRALGSAAKEFGAGALQTVSTALGGGPGSPMEMGEQYSLKLRQDEWDRKADELEAQGANFAEIQEKIGNRPDMMTVSEGIDALTGGVLKPQTATERTISKGGESAGEFAAINALLPGASTVYGLAREAGLGFLFGSGMNIAKEQGEGPLGQFATGGLFAATPLLLAKGKIGVEKGIELGKSLFKAGEMPQGVPKFLEESGTKKALADLELSSKNLLGRTAKISEESISKFEDLAGKVSKPAFEDVGTFRATDIEKDILKANEGRILDTISPGANTEKQAWEGIQKYVEGNFEALKNTYSKLYDTVQSQARNIGVIPRETAEAASKIYTDLQESIVKAPEEGGVKKALEELVRTLQPMTEGGLVEIPLSQLMAGKRSINRLLQKSDIIPGPVDLLKPVSAAMKQDTLKALENTALRPVFEAAENQFAEAQRVFNNDAVKKLRKTQNAEEMGNFFNKPSNLEKLKEAISDNQVVQDFTDRMVVENIASKNKAFAKELANENKQFLSKKAQDGLDKILEYGDTLTSKGQKSLARGNVLNDIQKAFDTGSRPDFTLKMMRDPKGYGLVKDTLNRSPKGKRMFKALQRMTFEDMINSVVGKDKQIDFEKAKDILANPHMKTVLKESMGEEGLKFFEKLETYGKNITQNLQTLKSKDPNIFKKLMETYLSSPLKFALFAIAPKGAAASILGGEVIKRANRVRLFKVLENPESRKFMQKLGRPNLSKETTQLLLKKFAQAASQIKNQKEENDTTTKTGGG
jgi:hypothetical protein